MPDVDPMLEDPKPEAHNDVVMQQYPSPTVDAQDTEHFYSNDPSGREQIPEQVHDAQPQHVPEHEAPSEEPQTPTQAAQSSITSAEELQLAAQLSQGLNQGVSPILDPNDDPNLRHVMDEHDPNDPHGPHDPHNPHEPQLQSHHDPLQEDHQIQHDHISENQSTEAMPNAEQSLTPHDSHESSVNHHEQLPPQHLEQQSQHHFLPDPQQHQPQHQQPQQPQPIPTHQAHQHPHLQPQTNIDHFGQHYAAHVPTVSDNIPPRKRSKVSRACDECRRKKVKCDAASESGDEPCSNCRRSSIRCLFSRIPQKRGPSKGYIKELADRIHHIEGKLASEGGNVDALSELLNGARRESDIFGSPSQGDENNRKRPYSSISGAEFGTPPSSRQNTWSSEPRPIQPYQTPSGDQRGTQYSANSLAPQPVAKPEATTPSQPAGETDSMSLDLKHDESVRELDDGAFNGYLDVVHRCFPVLAGTKTRVEAQLAQCPPVLRDAFTEALYGCMQSFVSVPGLYTNGDVGSASRMITEWESVSGPRSSIMNIVHLQTLVLAAIATDNYGSSSLNGEHGGPSKASILGRAVGLAYSMRLHMSSLEALDAELDHDADGNVAKRAWWTLIMLDRWNAIATASPLFIPNDSVVILPSLNVLLGDSVYHLARLSNILGHFAPVTLAPPHTLAPGTGAVSILNSFFNLSIELFREALPSDITPSNHPILHLVYWHCRLISYLFQTNSKSTDILWPCKESVGLLLANTQLLSPLNHHFFCLTTLSLLELAKVEKTKDEANQLLKELLDSNLAPSTWDSKIRDRIEEHVRPTTAQAAASQSLQRLADLATASDSDSTKPKKNGDVMALRTSDNFADTGFDPRSLTHGGYFNVFVDGLTPAAR
ncbi:hypothetical protein F5Y15DRAFT_29175 [Xylariaceae sp. FL0016]|nr:hypothetical protein F5Y15DRAFT_29175 [Xylariaceae sp. FL0016]